MQGLSDNVGRKAGGTKAASVGHGNHARRTHARAHARKRAGRQARTHARGSTGSRMSDLAAPH